MKTDIFSEAREKYTIADAWRMTGLEGEPRNSCRSPFRDETSPSFSIFDDGKAWCDHATGEGGDVIEFVCKAKGIDHREARTWFAERLGLDYHNPPDPHPPARPKPAAIKWPGELLTGTAATWEAFAASRGIAPGAVQVAVQAGILRFLLVDGDRCYCITDSTHRAAEIRRCNRKPFGKSKAYPLSGVSKSWLPGLAMMQGHPCVVIVEGAPDLLSAIHLYYLYRKSGGVNTWVITAALGATIRNLSPEAMHALKGKRIRLIPDGDDAGRTMSRNLTDLLSKNKSTVDTVILPEGTDLSDNLKTINPTELFSL